MGHPVAVKKIIESDFEGDAEFCIEVEIISNLKHRNLVPLRGCRVIDGIMRTMMRELVRALEEGSKSIVWHHHSTHSSLYGRGETIPGDKGRKSEAIDDEKLQVDHLMKKKKKKEMNKTS
ncbi:hypothetical protein Q3G72_025690 [Acer saccharum]|nr:hypothetical protein Q3G72_025690 [Acer saccharum]